MHLRQTLFVLPNLFTVSSLCCGVYAIITCLGTPTDKDFYRAALVVIAGMFLDAVDGRVARLTRTQSSFGTQMDSLADVVTFGVAPAVLVYRWTLWEDSTLVGLLACLAYVTAGAIRLARFNVLAERAAARDRQVSKYIVGMPIPTAAGVLVSLVVLNRALGGQLREASQLFVLLCLGLAALMVSPIRFRSFKDLRLNPRTILLLSLVLATSTLLAVYLEVSFVLIWLLGCYVALGLGEAVVGLSRRIRQLRGSRQPARIGPTARPPET